MLDSRRRILAAAISCSLFHAVFVSPRTASAVGSLPFIEDDYARALASAKARKVPIFLEAWAPWCHSCRSMRAFVYPDPKLAPYAERFVWLAIDTEKKQNAATVAKFPVGAWPSMYVIDPATETITHRWTGSATVEQLQGFLDEAAPAARAAGSAARSDLDVALTRADKLNGAAAWDAAATAYAAVVDHAPSGWAALPRAVDAYVFSLVKAERTEECARVSRKYLPQLVKAPASGSIAAMGLDCALALDATHVDRAATVAELERAARTALGDTTLGLAADDRSGLYMSLIGAREAAEDQAAAAALVKEWIVLLESAAAAAPNPDARAVFDPHRLTAYLEIREPQRAVPMLEASERDLPADYNPPARLAVAFEAMKQYDRALAASDRALALAYGPRRLGILRTRSKIQLGMGDAKASRKTLEGALQEAEALPDGQRSERQIAGLRKELGALDPQASPAAKP